MIYFLFSSQSSGSTFLQKELSRYVDIPKMTPVWTLNETEFGVLDWGAYFVYAPNQTIDFEPCRTHNPRTGKEVPKWRQNYRDYLSHSASGINMDFWDPETEDWYTADKYFREGVIAPLAEKYDLPIFDEKIYSTRFDYVKSVFELFAKYGLIFGKNPKWLNDFSGLTVRLLNSLIETGVPIKGIFLYRCPADTFTSILERKFRLEEMFKGNMDEYDEFVFDALEYSSQTGLALANRHGFFQLKYEEITEKFSDLLDYMNIDLAPHTLAYRKKYGRRYILNPRARNRITELRELGGMLGYSASDYPKKLTFYRYLWELLVTLFRTSGYHKENVNHPEKAREILERCFWYEAETPRALPLKRVYRLIRKRE